MIFFSGINKFSEINNNASYLGHFNNVLFVNSSEVYLDEIAVFVHHTFMYISFLSQ